MTDEKDDDNQSPVDRLIAVLLGLPWLKVLKQAWELIRKVMPGQSGGIYEVLESGTEGSRRAESHLSQTREGTLSTRPHYRLPGSGLGRWRDPDRLRVQPMHAGGPIPVGAQDLRPRLAARGEEQRGRGRCQLREESRARLQGLDFSGLGATMFAP
jgi:hypothetical protein